MLIAAARDGHLEVVRTLLSKYADIEAADSVSTVFKISVFFAYNRRWIRVNLNSPNSF